MLVLTSLPMRQAFTGAGFNMTAGSLASFSHSGQINLGFSLEGHLTDSVVAGQQFLVIVTGTDALASQVVSAA